MQSMNLTPDIENGIFSEKMLDAVNTDGPVPEDAALKAYYYLQKDIGMAADLKSRLGRTPTACVITFGCQMNARDSEKLSGVLRRAGFEITEDENADFLIYNTCTVRDNADQRVFGRLGRAGHYKKSNPGMKIALCGCMMQESSNVEKIQKSYPFVDLIFGTHNLYCFSEYLYRIYMQDEKIADIWDKSPQIMEAMPSDRKYPYRSGVNIMLGCDKFCTYCIVPYVRGREKSRDPEEILCEVRALAADGVKEIMLLGQNVNSYGKDLGDGVTFAGLIAKVAETEGIERVRFMTPHPRDFGDDLIEVIRSHPKIARHIHLPMQSGSTAVLKKMNRQYTKEGFLELAYKIRKELPDCSVTTDIIVGFPGETKEDVDDTIDVIKKVGFENAFTFIYSRRRGTPAASMPSVMTEEEIGREFDRVLKTVQETAKMKAELLTGSTMEALAEEVNAQDPSLITCRLSNNMIVHIPGDVSMIGKIIRVRLCECHGFYFFGEIEEG